MKVRSKLGRVLTSVLVASTLFTTMFSNEIVAYAAGDECNLILDYNYTDGPVNLMYYFVGDTVNVEDIADGFRELTGDDGHKYTYTFNGWFEEPECTNAYTGGTIDADKTIFADWSLPQMRVIYIDENQGDSLSGETVNILRPEEGTFNIAKEQLVKIDTVEYGASLSSYDMSYAGTEYMTHPTEWGIEPRKFDHWKVCLLNNWSAEKSFSDNATADIVCFAQYVIDPGTTEPTVNHTVEFLAFDAYNSIQSLGTVEVADGTAVTKPATSVLDDYNYIGNKYVEGDDGFFHYEDTWYVDNGNGIYDEFSDDADSIYNFNTPVTSDLKLLAPYSYSKEFTCNLYSNGGTFSDASTQKSVNTQSRITVINPNDSNYIPTRAGFTFYGWATRESSTDTQYKEVAIVDNNIVTHFPDDFLALESKTDLYAVWKPVVTDPVIPPVDPTPTVTKYTVEFIDWNSTVLKHEEVEEGQDATAPVNPSRAGYEFTGWDKAFTNVNNHLSVYAQYRLIETTPTPPAPPTPPVVDNCTITLNANNGVFSDSSITKTITDEKYQSFFNPKTEYIPTREGYTFKGWGFVENADLVNVAGNVDWKWHVSSSDDFIKVSENTSLFAQWEKNTEPAPVIPTPEPKPEPKPTPVEPVKPEPTPEPEPVPVIPEPVKPEPVIPTPEVIEPTPIEPVLPVIPEIAPIDEEEEPEIIIFPTVEPEPEDTIEEEKIEDIIRPIINIEGLPEEEEETVLDNGDDDKDTSSTAVGKFIEAVKRVAIVFSISVGAAVGLLGILLLLLYWRKRTKVENDHNDDEYADDNYKVVYKTSAKSEGNVFAELFKKNNRVWTVTVPSDIINERVTDRFAVVLKNSFVKKYNGEQLVIKLGSEEDAQQLGFIIDEQENTIKINYSEK